MLAAVSAGVGTTRVGEDTWVGAQRQMIFGVSPPPNNTNSVVKDAALPAPLTMTPSAVPQALHLPNFHLWLPPLGQEPDDDSIADAGERSYTTDP